MKQAKLLAALVAALAALCAGPLLAAKLINESKVIGLDGADRAEVHLRKSSGKMTIAGGGESLFEGDFSYSRKSLRPAVTETELGGLKTIKVVQPPLLAPLLGNVVNDWDIRLNDGAPMSLDIHNSSGSLDADLAGVDLERFEAESSSGASDVRLSGDYPSLGELECRQSSGEMSLAVTGDCPKLGKLKAESSSGSMSLKLDGSFSSPLDIELDSSSGRVDAELKGAFEKPVDLACETSSSDVSLDLGGTWKSGLVAKIETSSGSVIVKLPSGAGARFRADVSSGTVIADGFTRSGDYYVNKFYKDSDARIELDISTSSGRIEVLSD